MPDAVEKGAWTAVGKTRAELRAELIRRLESGEVKQANGKLRVGDTMCCIGVACDVFDPERWDGEDYLNEEMEPDTYCMPSDVMRAFGFHGDAGEIPNIPRDEEGRDASLSGQNDRGVTFPEIAAELRTGKYWAPDELPALRSAGGRG